MMRRIWLLALNDVRLTVRDRPALWWLVVLPIAMMWFFGSIGGGGSATSQIDLGLVDEDGGWVARAFVEELADEQIRLREPQADAAPEDRPVRQLVIPAGFTEGVLAGRQQALRLEQRPGSNAEYGVAAEVHVIRAIVRTLGRLVEMRRDGTLDADPVKGAPFDRFVELGGREDLVRLEVSTAGRGRSVPGGRAQSVPGILTFTVMMMTLIYGAVFLANEKRTGMLERQALLPMGRRAIIAGKLLGRLLIAGMQILLLVLAGRFLFGVDWGDSPAGLALMLVGYGASVASLSTLLGAVLKNAAQASAVGWIVSMVMAALGGCWWPAELMPGWMQTAARAFPTAWAMEGFHALISFGGGLSDVWVPAGVLFGFGVVFSVLGARWLRFER